MAYSCRPNRLVLVIVEVALFEGLQNSVIDELLSELAVVSWFSSLEAKIPAVGFAVRWSEPEEVVASLALAVWQPGRIAVRNQRTRLLFSQGHDTAYLNNEFTRALRPLLSDTVIAVQNAAIIRFGIDSAHTLAEISDSVRWDIMAAGQERLFSNLYELPRFHEGVLSIYRAGHLAGAWVGNYPRGHLLVC